MPINRRSFLHVTAITASLSAAAACSSSSPSPSSSSGAPAADATVDPAAPAAGGAQADLVIWADQKKAESIRDKAAAWGQAQGITVAVQIVANDLQPNFVTANQAGNGPDIVIGAHDWIGNLIQNGSIVPVSISAKAKENFSDVALAAVTYDSQTYAVPYAVECVALYINKALTSHTAPQSIEEIVEAGKAAGTKAVLAIQVGEAGDAYHLEPIFTAGGGYMFGKNADGSYNADDLGVGGEGSIKAAEKIAWMGQQGALTTSIDKNNAISTFTDGNAPYLLTGPWALADVKKAGMDYAVVKVPGFESIPGSQARPFAGVNCFYVASNGANKGFAESFVIDVAKDSSFAEAMMASNELPPAQKDLIEKLKSTSPEMAAFNDFAASADPLPSIPAMAAVWGPLGKAQANIINGADPTSTMTSAGEEIKRSIQG